ncbi:hypothetical protein [Flammeovirga kamogawensis]|uniref:DUF4919 domain-containing protein n=1 Tax=Flammeovirga kamogawensis TaxID=373891 RepID=A0ABX8H266_9BACT|nr:hypothetical protein [Flammeovirga kamogawensis]QWG09245.1 hypothetical protein KM029_21815 [Flammeovirga kamogawensis]QWG09892.1 hypothetical protein KM029_19620 [Flammeovirga kamogawensis]TRX64770.1 hypothetical protein EO216_19725 [Flammeovirga kamogawensis]TRX65396.1 hypothetical protein EO216_23015 [Flammeovirga kamogawensis]
MSKFIILLILLSHSVIGQNVKTDKNNKNVMEQFHQYYSYVPKPTVTNTSLESLKSKYYSFNDYSIEKLSVFYDRNSQSINDLIFLERQIITLSENLFKEHKYILLQVIGGAKGCIEPWYEEKKTKNIEIKIIRLCAGCLEFTSINSLARIYNVVMKKLLCIDPEPKHVKYKSNNYEKNFKTILDFDLVNRSYTITNIETQETIDRGFWTEKNRSYYLVSTKNDTRIEKFEMTNNTLISKNFGKFKLLM